MKVALISRLWSLIPAKFKLAGEEAIPLTKGIPARVETFGLGAALYRAGRYEESIRCFEAEAKAFRPRAWDWAFRAMAHRRLGHAAEARRCLAEAVAWMEEANRQEFDDQTSTWPASGVWDDLAAYPLLVREAEALLRDAGQEPPGTAGR